MTGLQLASHVRSALCEVDQLRADTVRLRGERDKAIEVWRGRCVALRAELATVRTERDQLALDQRYGGSETTR